MQTTPQCFDISLWQLVAALLVGGRTVIVRQNEILDVDRLAERIVAEDVETNHEVLTAPPADDRVPLGRAVNNVRVYVVDEHLQPVPLGAPGEIVFSGVCVGRGYVNDEERTRAAFGADPHRSGERLYRSGDFGHWLLGGTLAFLGRREAQVKIRGFRIEWGEGENQTLALPEVREAAVVVCGAGSDSAYLAGAYVSADLDAEALRAALHARLPDYMVPAVLVRLDRMSLTGNGKTDRGLLRRMAVMPDACHPPHRPSYGSPRRGPPSCGSRSSRSAATTTSSAGAVHDEEPHRAPGPRRPRRRAGRVVPASAHGWWSPPSTRCRTASTPPAA